MAGREEFMDIQELWVRGKNVSEISRLTGRDRKTVHKVIQEGGQRPASLERCHRRQRIAFDRWQGRGSLDIADGAASRASA